MFSAVPPWKYSSPAGVHTLSPARSTTVFPSRVPTSPVPSVHISSCPLTWLCQLVRAPGVNRTKPQVSREVPSPPNTGFIQTSPVKHDDGVFTVPVLGFLSMCPSYRAGRCYLGSHAHEGQSTRVRAPVGVPALTGNGGTSLAAARSPSVELWTTERRSASSSPPGGHGSPPTRPACPPTAATAGSRACAGKRSHCSRGSASTTTSGWNAATSRAPPRRSSTVLPTHCNSTRQSASTCRR